MRVLPQRPLSLWSLALVTVVLALPGRAAVGAGADEDEAVSLVARARALHDLRRLAEQPYHLRAEVSIHRLVSGSKQGQYVLKRSLANDWFVLVTVPGYREIEGVTGAVHWRKRASVDRPLRVHQVYWTMDVVSHLDLPADTRAGSLTRRLLLGREARCAKFTPTAAYWQHDLAGTERRLPVARDPSRAVELCFDAETGALVRADYGTPLPTFEYEGRVELGRYALPKLGRYLEDGEVAVEVRVDELIAEPATLAGEVPPGAETWPHCEEPEPPTLKVKPSVPEVPSARVRRQFGTVIVFAEVGKDGSLHDLAFFQGMHPTLNAAVRDAVGAWEYSPATCSGQAVPQPIFLAVQFRP